MEMMQQQSPANQEKKNFIRSVENPKFYQRESDGLLGCTVEINGKSHKFKLVDHHWYFASANGTEMQNAPIGRMGDLDDAVDREYQKWQESQELARIAKVHAAELNSREDHYREMGVVD